MRAMSVLFLLLFLPLSPLAAQEDEQNVLRYSGAEIPNYFAWNRFFSTADQAYRMGSGYYWGFVKHHLKAHQMLSEAPSEVTDEMLLLMADAGMRCQRSGDTARANVRSGRVALDEGAISQGQHESDELNLYRRHMRLIRSERDALRRKLIQVHPELGTRLWALIEECVQGTIKDSMSIVRTLRPHDEEMWRMWLEFDQEKGERL